ncbi:MAG: cobalt-zinc-cadmium efflux system protein [Cyclobacteriaceae bacterium]|jgi:cobalt-zinc-cadmium efflux system protein
MGNHHRNHDIDKLKAAFFLNLFFTVIELVGGIWTNSIAIISDAIHDLGDSISLGISWYLQNISEKKPDKKYSYGYKRFSILGAIINSIVLIVGSIFIILESIPRLIHPETPDSTGMMFLAIGGLFFNGLAAYKLHGGESINSRAVYLHLLEDVLGWFFTLVAAVIMHFFNVPILDPILGVGIAIFILTQVFKNLKKALRIILQQTPEGLDMDQIHSKLKSINEIKSIHDCHAWTMDGQYHILSLHLVLHKSKSIEELHALKTNVKESLYQQGINHATIEFETAEENCAFELTNSEQVHEPLS